MIYNSTNDICCTNNLIPNYYYTNSQMIESQFIDRVKEKVNKTKENREENVMEMNFMKDMFGAVKSGLCRLSIDGSVAVKTANGYKSYNATSGAFVNCDNFVFDIGDEMFFVIPTNSVTTGDIILAGGEPRYVLKVEDNMLTVINYKNGTVENLLPEHHMFMGNTYFYGKIVSMFGNMNNLTGGSGSENVMKYFMLSQMFKKDSFGSGNMNPMMLMMMMNGGGFGDIFNEIFNNNSKSVKTETKEEK